MKTVIIYGQSHKGSTYHIGHMLGEKIGGEVVEFFLPKDFDEFCLGCTNCFMKGEEFCPHHEKLKKIVDELEKADVIILSSPVYCMHASGAMKAFLDHLGYMWMAHRPKGEMFSKIGVCISTGAGAGMKRCNKDMADSLFYWGVPKIYQYGKAVAAQSYEEISDDKKKEIDNKTSKLARIIKKKNGKVKPGFKTKAFFFIMHLMQKNGWNKKDSDYWKKRGWTEKKRPWKNNK